MKLEIKQEKTFTYRNSSDIKAKSVHELVTEWVYFATTKNNVMLSIVYNSNNITPRCINKLKLKLLIKVENKRKVWWQG